MRIFHLVRPADWAAALESGQYRPLSLGQEGFVHFSLADQVAGTANLLYADEPELLVVEIDAEALDTEVVVEDSYGSGTSFPHVYGPIPTSAARATRPLERAPDGAWRFTPGG